MGIYQKYRDKNGNPHGPWFVKYPYQRDALIGKIIYKVQKASHSKKLAEKFLRMKEDEFFRRDEQGLALEERKPKMKFSEMLDWYLEQELVKAKKSFRCDLYRGQLLMVHFGEFMADEITQIQVRNFQIKRKNESSGHGKYVKPATINREIALMRAAYNLAMDQGLVTTNPCRKIKMLKENNVRDRVLSVEDFERLCNELNPVARRVVQTAYHTGMRKSEILNLTIDKIHLEDRFIDLDADDTKDHERRRIYFNNELYRIFKICLYARNRMGVKHRFVFVRENGNPVKCVRTAFKNACNRVGIEDFRFHDLRHTYNTDMRKAGVHDTVIMKQTGHATMEMFLRYNTIDEKDGRSAVLKRDAYLAREKAECSLCAPKVSDSRIDDVTV